MSIAIIIPSTASLNSMEESRYQGIPQFVYGGAFKGDETDILVEQAILQGFSGVDTAGFNGAYNEKLTGKGIREAMTSRRLKRSQLHIQTKFTPYIPGVPAKFYPQDPTASIETQVAQSIANSLKLLDVSTTPDNAQQSTYIDVLTLHVPYPTMEETLQAWKAMEKFVPKQVSALGVSNIFVDKLRILYDEATIKPVLVQNCFPDTNEESAPETPPTWDGEVRQFCKKHGIVYQPYGVFKKASAGLLESEVVVKFSKDIGVSVQLSLYLFILGLGDKGEISILDGTTKKERMAADLEGLKTFEAWVDKSGNEAIWNTSMAEFKRVLGD